MARKIDIKKSLTGVTFALKRALDDPKRILSAIGDILIATAQKSFVDQRLGPDRWAPRYPNQAEPFVNIAGALQDLSRGPRIKERRYERRPALIDRGTLRASVSSRSAMKFPGKYRVEVGTVLPYATVHQYGGESRMTITDTMRRNFAELERKAMRAATKAPYSKSARGKPKVLKARRELERLAKIRRALKRNVLVTRSPARPFLGVPPEAETKLIRIIEGNIPKVLK